MRLVSLGQLRDSQSTSATNRNVSASGRSRTEESFPSNHIGLAESHVEYWFQDWVRSIAGGSKTKVKSGENRSKAPPMPQPKKSKTSTRPRAKVLAHAP